MMIIIAILMALVLGISASVGRAQDKARAETHMAYLRTMIEEYKQKERQLPVHQTVNGTPTLCFRSSQDLDMIEEAQDELGIQFANTSSYKYPVDPWGQPFFYERLDPNNNLKLGKDSYRMGSKGPDGKFGKNGSSTYQFGQGDDIK